MVVLIVQTNAMQMAPRAWPPSRSSGDAPWKNRTSRADAARPGELLHAVPALKFFFRLDPINFFLWLGVKYRCPRDEV